MGDELATEVPLIISLSVAVVFSSNYGSVAFLPFYQYTSSPSRPDEESILLRY